MDWDDMDWDDALGVALEGFEPPAQTRETPNLAQLAREGSSYRRSYAAQPVCSASRATLLDSGGYAKAYPVWGTDLALSMPRQVATTAPVIVRIALSAAAPRRVDSGVACDAEPDDRVKLERLPRVPRRRAQSVGQVEP
ncbi:MAG: hypothetical protein RLY21_1854 [Planctomycetota bacterium]